MTPILSRETLRRPALAAPLIPLMLLVLLSTLGAACRGLVGSSYEFTWLHGGAPVSGLEVTLLDNRGRALVAGPLRNGRIRAPRPAVAVRVIDPEHGGVVLLDQPLAGGAPIRVPEAIRVKLRVEGARAETVVRVGSGPRLATAERYTREHGKQWMRHPRDGEAFGVPVAPSAARWAGAERIGADSFDSGWIAAAEAPQIVALDRAASFAAVSEVPLPPRVGHGMTLDGGVITLPRSRAIDLAVEVPGGELPPALLVTLEPAAIDAARRDEAGRALSVLDQIDPRLFEHALLRAPLYLPASGRLRLAGLPPFDRVEIGVLDVDRGTRVTRTVRVTGDAPATVSIAASELDPPRGAPRAIGGQVVAADRRPLARARVVLSNHSDRFETVTDAAGRFTFPSVPADRFVTVFVEPPASAAASSASHIFRAIDTAKPLALVLPRPAGPGPGPTRSALPGAPPGAPQIDIQCRNLEPTSNDQYPSVAGMLNGEWAVADILDGNWSTGEFLVQASASGTWVFYYYPAAFVGFQSQGDVLQAGEPKWITANQPFNPTLRQASLKFVRLNVFPMSNTTITFPSLLPDPDPLEIDTNDDGFLYLTCINTNPIAVYVRTSDGWCYDGDVNLRGVFTQIELQKCAGQEDEEERK